jgi:hypothetical protein
MKTKRFPSNYDIDKRFPDARLFRIWMGGGALKAEKNNKFYLIIDEGTLADFLDERDAQEQEILKELVTIIEFDNEEEREDYIAKHVTSGVDISRDAKGKLVRGKKRKSL